MKLPSPSSGKNEPRLTYLLALLLILLCLAAYWPALSNQFVNYDDEYYVTANPQVQDGLTLENVKWAFTHVVNCNWHPMTVLSHMLDCQLYGLNPRGHHLTSILLNALATVLLFVLFRRMTDKPWPSFWLAALFATQPLHVESVAWIAERKDVLSASFGFLTLWLYIRYAQGKNSAAAGEGNAGPVFYRSRIYWLALFVFALGLMSKPMLVTWPFVLLLLDYWPLKRLTGPTALKMSLLEKLPFLALAVAASAATVIAQRQEGAIRGLGGFPAGMRIENALVSYGRYLSKIVWPTDLAVFYPYPDHWPLAQVMAAFVLLAGVSIVFWMHRQRYPFLLMGWCWFLGTLIPVIGLVQVGGQSIADRYTYIPSVGILLIVVWGANALFSRIHAPRAVLSAAVSTTIIAAFAATHRQISFWKDSETLYRHSLRVAGESDVIHNNLGAALLEQCRTNDAIREFQKAIGLNPGSVEAQSNLGDLLLIQGQTNQAISHFQTAIRYRPDYPSAHFSLGYAFARQGKLPEAINEFKAGIGFKDASAADHYTLGNLLAKSDQSAPAIGEFQTAIHLRPDYVDAYNGIGDALASQGRTNEAVAAFQEAIRIKPSGAEAHLNLANILSDEGDWNAAISEFKEYVGLKPNDAVAHYKLGNLLAKKGLADDASKEFQESIRCKYDFAEAHNNLGNLFAVRGQADEAIREFQTAIQLKGEYADAHYNLGVILFKQDRNNEAIEEFQAVTRLDPHSFAAHYYLGAVLGKNKRYDEAISEFQEVVRLAPGNATAHNQLGACLAETGRIDEAISEFQSALRLKQDYSEAQANLQRALEIKNKGH